MRNSARSASRNCSFRCRGPQPPGSEPKSAAFLGLWREPPYYYLFFAGPALSSVRCWRAQAGWQLRRNRLDYDSWQQMHRRATDWPLSFEPAHCHYTTPVLHPNHIHTGLVLGPAHPSTQACLMALADLYCRHIPQRGGSRRRT
jgi:hypothetical protein